MPKSRHNKYSIIPPRVRFNYKIKPYLAILLTKSRSSVCKRSNPNAYCDICQKQFCNKYYLATHRNLRHSMLSQGMTADLPLRGEMPQGMDMQQLIMSMDPANNRALQNLYMSQMGMNNGSPSPSSLPSSGSASTTGPTTTESQPITEAPQKTASPPADMGGNMNLQNLFAGLMPQATQQNGMPSEMSNLLEQMQSMQNGMGMFNPLAALQGNNLLQQLNASPKKQKRFDDQSLKLNSPQQQQGMNFGAFPFSLAPSTSTASQHSVIVNSTADSRDDVTPPAQKRSRQEDDEERGVKNSLDNLLLASMTGGGGTACDDCGKECGSPLGLFTHKAKDRCTDNIKCASPTVLKCGECDKEFESMQYLEQHKLVHHSGMAQRLLAGMGLPQGFPGLNFMMPGMPQQFAMPDFDPAAAMAQLSTPKPATVKRQYSSNGKNYCDLCNKEVCNKYFLRTHMLKMHGIVIDENKTVIANIDTLEKERMGTLSFRCDICHMELKSRHLLRAHKQDSHGVMPISNSARNKSMPSTPTMVSAASSMNMAGDESKCPMCDRRMPGSQLASHIQIDHAGDMSAMLMGQQVSAPPMIECKFCPSVFKDEMESQMHQIQAHPAEFLQNQMKEERKVDPNVLRCKECQYSTKEPRNLEMHMERHERMNEAKQQPEDDKDEALQMTTEVALQMAAANKMDVEVFKCTICDSEYSDETSLDAHAAVAHNGLNLTVPKKDGDVEKTHERNSHTSGSISPSTDSLPEGFGKAPPTCEKPFVMQSFILKTNDAQGNFLGEIVAHLPVKALISSPTQVTFELVPQSTPNPF